MVRTNRSVVVCNRLDVRPLSRFHDVVRAADSASTVSSHSSGVQALNLDCAFWRSTRAALSMSWTDL
ncbi:Uncharacterised protein [Mycobacteroides abscessus subsp. abscessus]|nr:Uncharacterised protein [Mycobacteroides abscessus subsp. abscessus]